MQSAILRVRLSTVIGFTAPLSQYALFLVEGNRRESWSGELSGFFVVGVVAGAMGLIAWLLLGWYFVYPLLRISAYIVNRLVAWRVPVRDWIEATNRATWTLPYSAGAAVVLYLGHELFGLGSWHNNGVIAPLLFGALGLNVIAAFSYITLIVYWFQAYRRAKKASDSP